MLRQLLTLVTLSCCLLAQASVQRRAGSSLSTAGDFGNYAVEGAQEVAHGIQKGTTLPAGYTAIDASAWNASAETVIGWHDEGGGVVSVSLSEQATGWALNGAIKIGTMAAAGARRDEGPHGLRFTVRALAGTRGKIGLWAMGFVSADADTAISIDIGDDGVVDLGYVATRSVVLERRQWDVRIPPSGSLDVIIRTQGRATAPTGGQATYFSGLTVRFTPGSFCDIARHGEMCAGNLLGSDSASSGAHMVLLELEDAPATVPGVLVIGVQAVTIPIPGSSCLLYTNPVVAIPLITDSRGDASRRLPLPIGVGRFDVFCQCVMATAAWVASSNSVAVSWRR